jgi:hypothetical protein
MKQCKPSSTAQKSPVIASLALACVMAIAASNVHASTPTTDVPAFGQRLAKMFQVVINKGKDWAEMVKKYEEIRKQIPDLSQYTDLLGAGTNTNILDNINKRPLSYGLERCDQGGGGGFDIKSLLGGLIPSSGGNYVAKQKDICQKIVTLENAKYNDLVDALTDLKKLKEKLVDENNDKAKSIGGKQGEADIAKVSASASLAEMEQITAKIEITTMVYDGMIQSLNTDMKNVATEALNGKKQNLLENIVSTAAGTLTMKVALDAQESPCPSGFNCDSDFF